jgi:hypothetical protein
VHLFSSIFTHPEFLGTMAVLALVLLAGLAGALWIRRWRQEWNESPPSADEEMESYRTLQEQGELSEEEMERIRLLVRKPDSAGEDQNKPH